MVKKFIWWNGEVVKWWTFRNRYIVKCQNAMVFYSYLELLFSHPFINKKMCQRNILLVNFLFVLALPILFRFLFFFISLSYLSNISTTKSKTPKIYLSYSLSLFLSSLYSYTSPTYILFPLSPFSTNFLPLYIPIPHELSPPLHLHLHLGPLPATFSLPLCLPYLPWPHYSHLHIPHHYLHPTHRIQII